MNINEKEPLKTNRLIEGKKESSMESDFSQKLGVDGKQDSRPEDVWNADRGTES